MPFLRSWATRSFLLLYSQKWKATSIRKCLPVFFSQLCRPNAIVGFFLDLFVYLLRCLMISLYWDVSCVWAQYIYLESGKSTMAIEPCHVFARWGVTLSSLIYLPVKPKTAPSPPGGGKGRKGFHNSFRIQHVQRVHGSLFIYSLFCWSIWEL